MIISASRRGDIPAFHSAWFMDCLRRGEAVVANPFRPKQTRVVDLRRDAVAALVFWTRDPRPLMKHLDEIDDRGYPYYFLITLTGYPRFLEPGSPGLAPALSFFAALAARIGRKRIVWRYDPVIFSNATGCDFHRDNFLKLAGLLAPFAFRVIISFIDPYPKALRRMQRAGFPAGPAAGTPEQQLELLGGFAAIADRSGLEIQSCAEGALTASVAPGKCIDEKLLNELFGLNLAYRKDPSQRKLCFCQESVDIGSYGTCRHGCLYCYAR
ncbi:MAG: DUF1848 domain-containing protein [Candidatus Aminicenantes bacterium]|nr:DUF1848 domain-containing protein [Candidatus Aminicenantes bacterium]